MWETVSAAFRHKFHNIRTVFKYTVQPGIICIFKNKKTGGYSGKNKKNKIIGGINTLLATLYITGSKVFAGQVAIDSNGGAILTDVGSKFKTLASDIAATLQVIIPIVGVGVCLWYLFKIMTGDEQDQMRYKKSLVKVIVVVIVAELAVVLINLVMKYFG